MVPDEDVKAVHRGSSAFGRDARLHVRAQLEKVRTEGRSVAARTCVVNVLKTPPDFTKRAAFSISRRFSLLAVERNRARRLFREAYREIYPLLPVCWMIFVPRQKIKRVKYQEVIRDVRWALAQLEMPLEEGRTGE